MTVEAGCILQQLQEAAREAGCLFPLSLAAEGSCTIGGNLATNAGGTQVLRYGNARELCLGLEVVTPQGEVWDGLRGLRKDNTGYDLRDLFIGSEGTLGVITAATLKLYPAAGRAGSPPGPPCPRWSTRCGCWGWRTSSWAPALTGFEVMGTLRAEPGGEALSPQRAPARWPTRVALVRAAGELRPRIEEHARARFEALLEKAFEDGCVTDAVVGREPGAGQGPVALRESISAGAGRRGPEHQARHLDAVSRIPAFVAETDALLQQRFPACAWSTSATWATATCTTTCRRRPTAMRAPSW